MLVRPGYLDIAIHQRLLREPRILISKPRLLGILSGSVLLGLYRRHPPLGFVDRAGRLLLKGVECVGVLRSADRLSR